MLTAFVYTNSFSEVRVSLDLPRLAALQLPASAVADALRARTDSTDVLAVAKRAAEIGYVDMRYTNGFSVGWNSRSALAVVPQEDATPDG